MIGGFTFWQAFALVMLGAVLGAIGWDVMERRWWSQLEYDSAQAWRGMVALAALGAAVLWALILNFLAG